VSTFAVTYDAELNANVAAKTAFQAVLDYWSRTIVSNVPITVSANFDDLGGGPGGTTLGFGGPQLVMGFGGQPMANTWYPEALANAIANQQLSPTADISVTFNSNAAANWYFGTDGAVSSTQIDFESVAHHEMAHGFGHIGDLVVGSCPGGGPNDGCFAGGPAIYDRFTETAAGTSLLTLSASALGAAAKTPKGVVFDGPATRAAGGPGILHTPTSWDAGSYAHVDNVYDGTADSLMTPSVARGEVARPSQIVLGILKDIGYTLAAPTTYQPLQPARLLDTRVTHNPIGNAATINLTVVGVGGVPATGVGAVALNVTVNEPTADGFLTVFPAGQSVPTASNLNFVPGQTVPNMVVVKVGTGGQVSIFNSQGSTPTIVDVEGWFPAGSSFVPMAPVRLLDSRPPVNTPIPQNTSITVPVTGSNGVPADASAVVLNVTATEPTAQGFFTVYPTGGSVPTASNVNFRPGQTTPNLVVAKVGTGGAVNIFNAFGTTHVIVDISGYFPATGSEYHPLPTPNRIIDTRPNNALGQNVTLDVSVLGLGVPTSAVTAVVLNVTATDATAWGFFTIFPVGQPLPTASNLNFVAGPHAVPNLVVAKVGSGGKISVFNAFGSTHLIIDVAGYFSLV